MEMGQERMEAKEGASAGEEHKIVDFAGRRQQ